MRIGYFACVSFIACASCQPTSYVGHYELKHFPKTRIELKSDKSFEFIRISPNPYLHPFDHPTEYYFTTAGKWNVENGKLILRSFTDSIENREPDILENTILADQTLDTTRNLKGEMELLGHSIVTFYDIFDDTVNVLSVQFPDSTGISLFHRSMKYVNWFTQLNDTAEFHFYGYPPFKFTRTDKKRRVLKIKLYPEYKPSIFIDRNFKINRRGIRDARIKFIKKTKPHPSTQPSP